MKSSPRKVSIVMPVKNADPYLEDCLLSIQNQSYPYWELLAVDDHSEDASGKILKDLASKDPRIKVFKNKEKGIIPALQLAYSNSLGHWVTRMDADDLMPPNKLQTMTQQLVAAGLSHVAIGLVQYFSTDKMLGEGYKKYQDWLNSLSRIGTNFKEIYKECVIPSPCWMMYKQDLEKMGAFNLLEYPEDYDLCFKMYAHGITPIPSEEVLHYWRDHTDRSSRNLKEYADNRFLDIKIKYFLQLDYKGGCLILWGAGKKGKYIAKQLIHKGTNFIWISNNPNKIGKSIYGVGIQGEDLLGKTQSGQVILAIAGIDKPKVDFDKSQGLSFYSFC
jgi:glycosyltransferase involved in cell wall biosynthesis